MITKKEDIELWLIQNGYNRYEIFPDYSGQYAVSLKTGVDLSYKDLKEIPINFYEVGDYFLCNNNNLKSLKGCPKIIRGSFDCSNNEIENLNYFPQKINKNISIENNKIKELKNLPEKVNGNFNCSDNLLTSLKNTPLDFNSNFYFKNNPLKKLDEFFIGQELSLDLNIINLLNNKMIEKINEKKDLKIYFNNNVLSLQEFNQLIKNRNLNKKLQKKLNIKTIKVNNKI